MTELGRFFEWRTPALAAAAALLVACSGVTADSFFTSGAAPTPGADDAGSPVSGDSTTPLPHADAGRDAAKPHDDAAPPDGDCSTAPPQVAAQAIADVWAAGLQAGEASGASPVWIPDVAVTGTSRSGCAAGQACVVYVQATDAFASFDDAAHQAIKVAIDAPSAGAFAGIAAGDRVSLLAWSTHGGADADDEVSLAVDASHAGCIHKSGSASVTPVEVDLGALTHDSYAAHGPVLVKVSGVSGHAGATARATFALYPTGFSGQFPGGGEIVSLSPFLLPAAKFAAPLALDQVNDFGSVTGIFAVFVPTGKGGGAPPKFLELYPRTASDLEL